MLNFSPAIRRAAPSLVLMLGLVLTALVTWRTWNAVRHRNELRFRSTTEQLAQAITGRVEIYLALLRGSRGLLQNEGFRTKEQFRTYIQSLRIESRYPGIQGIGFAQRAEPADREAVNQQWRTPERPNFRIWPEQTEETAFTIVLLEPNDERNQRAFGFDMYSEPVRRQAMQRAWRVGSAAASGKVTLVQETEVDKQAGFLIYLPLYPNPPPDSEPAPPAAAPGQSILGFVYAPFRANDLFAGIITPELAQNVQLQVFDGDETTPENLLYASPGSAPGRPHLARTIQILGRTWTVVFTNHHEWADGSRTVWWTLAIGLVLTTLLVVLVRNLEAARADSERHTEALIASEQLARNNERLKQAILDAALDGIVTADGQGIVVEFNSAAERVFGYRREAVIGQRFVEIVFPPRLRQEYDRAMQRLLLNDSGGLLGHRMEVTATRADGQEFPAEIAINRIELQGRHMFTAYLRDITERREADARIQELHENLERRVQQRTAELEDANRQLESFSYSVSHDLRAPARHVLGFAELLNKQLSGWSDPAAQRLVRVITESARRMAQLIDDLLTFSRTSRQEMRRGPVNMNRLVADAVRLLAPETVNRRIEWRIPPLPTVDGDAALLAQVWFNLLSNAIKYTRHRDVAVIVIEGRQEADEAAFSVRDNGTGFDMQYAHKLFGVFQRLHREEEFEGTGIGLANVARIIQRHGGRVWASAAPNVGATFFFTLPRRIPGSAPVSTGDTRSAPPFPRA
jgi:PAS domain S-box-containing protein